VAVPVWAWWLVLLLMAAAAMIIVLAKNWSVSRCASTAVGVSIVSMLLIAGQAPSFETDLRLNQTLKPLGALVQENVHPGDALLLWGQLPEGLPFYSGGVISATNRPYFGGMNLTHVPFEFPGNQERMGDFLLPNEADVIRLLAGDRRVVVIVAENMSTKFHQATGRLPLHPFAKSGIWQLYSNR